MGEAERMIVAVGSDDAGAALLEQLRSDLSGDPRVAEVIDVSGEARESDYYAGVAGAAARLVADGRADRAVLVCGTGLGMAISANKVPGVRAVTAHDSYSVERAVLSNNAQVLCFGERVVGAELARRLLREWLDYRFASSSASAPKVDAIMRLEADARRSESDSKGTNVV